MVKEEVLATLTDLDVMLSILDNKITDCITTEVQEATQLELNLMKIHQSLQLAEKKVKLIKDIRQLKSTYQKPPEAVLELGS
ncbi:hypothetical protein [Bacillus sp. 2205SS5-2]|uniref:hypothetical protein n=1 Tax=Bacillus sp. 2205SS5-2 TaxID=3109031 RepID=UPI0030078B0A